MPLHGLEGELREIVRHRDEIVADDFDHVVEKAREVILDKHCTFASLAADICSPEHSGAGGALADLLIRRENTSSTVLTPAVAIPHLTVEGEKTFELIIVRNQQGVKFNSHAPNVRAVFFLFGTADRRNLHLKSLAAIAQIIQSPSFEARWDKADTPEKIRDMLLLSRRKRSLPPEKDNH